MCLYLNICDVLSVYLFGGAVFSLFQCHLLGEKKLMITKIRDNSQISERVNSEFH